jgi:CubicO group peptidase (beta-lactamase class C family)
MQNLLALALLSLLFMQCKDQEMCCEFPPTENVPHYFPPANGNWETVSADSLHWNTNGIDDLYNLLEDNKSRAFLVLQNGKIVLEKYWGKDVLNINNFDASKAWYWASAGKTLTGFMVGKAQQDGYLNINDKTNKYLGNGWTSLTQTQEDKISVWNQLTMTTGLDDGVANSDATKPSDLLYLADAGTRWAYHNAPYTILDTVVESATGQPFESYFNEKLRNQIGMDGQWLWVGNNHVYCSTSRSMARFGILMQNNGVWGNTRLIDSAYLQQSVTKSQDINNAYGYLWWLNNSNSFMLPGSQIKFPGNYAPNAPKDMFAALGKNGQFLCVVPSLNLIMVRMGENPDNSLVPVLFLDDIWEKLNSILP